MAQTPDIPSAVEPSSTGSRRRFRRVAVVLLVLLAGAIILLSARRPLLTKAAAWLVIAQPPSPAEIIVVHAGEPERLAYAAELVEAGIAHRLYWNIDGSYRHSVLGLDPEELVGISRDYLLAGGLAADDLIMVEGATSTWDEVVRFRDFARKEQIRSAVVVSNPFHMRRIAMLYEWLIPEGEIELRFCPVPLDRLKLSLDEWWTREQELIWVNNEYNKILLYRWRRLTGAGPGLDNQNQQP